MIGLKTTTIYEYVRELKQRQVIRKEGRTYSFNAKRWPKLYEAIKEMKRFERNTDSRISTSATIYHKNSKELLFSCKEEVDASKTAFSAYEHHGITVTLLKNYYTLPKRNVTREEILTHSLYVVEQEKTIRHIIILSLFYMKYKKEFPEIQDEILDKIDKIIEGEQIEGERKTPS